MTNNAILQRLEELTNGLYYMSESDYPLEVVHYDKVESSALSETKAKVETIELAYFLRNMTKAAPEADDAAKQVAERYQTLQTFMEQHLGDVKVYRIGRREVVALAIGALPEGGYGGFKTTLIET